MAKCKCPKLTPRYKREWLNFAISHQNWTLDDWKRVIWSDETKINLMGSDGRSWAWKKKEEGLSDRLVVRTRKFERRNLMI